MPVAMWWGGCLTCPVSTDPVSYPRLVRPAQAPISFSDSRALGLNVLFLKEKKEKKNVTYDSQLKTLILLLLRQYAETKKAHPFLYWSLFSW